MSLDFAWIDKNSSNIYCIKRQLEVSLEKKNVKSRIAAYDEYYKRMCPGYQRGEILMRREKLFNLGILSSFMLSNKQVKNPNIYPYNVFRGKYIEPFVFSPITVFYGNNGSGKSTLLNIIANKLQLKGKEYATSNSFGIVDYCNAFSNECSYSLGEDDFGFVIKQEEYIKFAQEKYSNGETSMQYFEEYLQPNALYLLDEPEVSLSPSNQVLLANEINKLARLLECQFVIATHSPFMLGTLNAKIYNIDTKEYDVVKWNELENVQYFYNFFKKHEQEFEEVIHESGE